VKSTLFLPTLFCEKIAGPFEEILIRIVTSKKTGDKITSPTKEMQTSKKRVKSKFESKLKYELSNLAEAE